MVQLEEEQWAKIRSKMKYLNETEYKRKTLIMELENGIRGLGEKVKCKQCDPDVGFTCPACYSVMAMREAASYLKQL